MKSMIKISKYNINAIKYLSYNSSSNTIMSPTTEELYKGIQNKNRNSLSRAISLIESYHPAQFEQAQLLLNKIIEFQKSKVNKKLNLTKFRKIIIH